MLLKIVSSFIDAYNNELIICRKTITKYIKRHRDESPQHKDTFLFKVKTKGKVIFTSEEFTTRSECLREGTKYLKNAIQE